MPHGEQAMSSNSVKTDTCRLGSSRLAIVAAAVPAPPPPMTITRSLMLPPPPMLSLRAIGRERPRSAFPDHLGHAEGTWRALALEQLGDRRLPAAGGGLRERVRQGIAQPLEGLSAGVRQVQADRR